MKDFAIQSRRGGRRRRPAWREWKKTEFIAAALYDKAVLPLSGTGETAQVPDTVRLKNDNDNLLSFTIAMGLTQHLRKKLFIQLTSHL